MAFAGTSFLAFCANFIWFSICLIFTFATPRNLNRENKTFDLALPLRDLTRLLPTPWAFKIYI